jgi:hypothetical protein
MGAKKKHPFLDGDYFGKGFFWDTCRLYMNEPERVAFNAWKFEVQVTTQRIIDDIEGYVEGIPDRKRLKDDLKRLSSILSATPFLSKP